VTLTAAAETKVIDLCSDENRLLTYTENHVCIAASSRAMRKTVVQLSCDLV